jgi:hypothetical protein
LKEYEEFLAGAPNANRHIHPGFNSLKSIEHGRPLPKLLICGGVSEIDGMFCFVSLLLGDPDEIGDGRPYHSDLIG